MTPDIERTIVHYYPRQALVSPLEDDQIRWDYDPDQSVLREVLRELRALDPDLRNGTRGRYDLSEEIVLFGQLRLQLCYLGPYAALNYGVDRFLDEEARDHADRVRRILESHGISILSDDELEESVPWIRDAIDRGSRVTVWHCLFAHPEA